MTHRVFACVSAPALLWAALLANATTALSAPPASRDTVRAEGAGVNFRVMHHMTGADGDNADSPLVVGPDGVLYGVSRYGGPFGDGTLFNMMRDGTVKKLHYFEQESEASRPQGLMLASDGHFYGTARYGGWTGRGMAFRFDPPEHLNTVIDFHGEDGAQPANGLIEGHDGALYGTTYSGGAFGTWGTAFRLTVSGEVMVLHSFNNDGTDGYNPSSRLAQGADGAFYGTTTRGGRHGFGTAFRLTLAGDYTTLHDFDGSDGRKVLSGLVEGPDGWFYGAAFAGGANNDGTLFRLNRDGEFAVLRSFARHGDGAHPGDLLFGRDGYLYGTTKTGGRGHGTVYRAGLDGSIEVLHQFDGGMDGDMPLAGLVERDDGEFFGITSAGGEFSRGTIFRLRMK